MLKALDTSTSGAPQIELKKIDSNFKTYKKYRFVAFYFDSHY